MRMFWEFFTFELRFRLKSLSTYVYFGLWLLFSFLCVASESFGPVGSGNGKILLNGPFANYYNDIGAMWFGSIIVAAIFGTSILRDFQRDTFQILFTKPISKFAYLGGRWAGSFVTTVLTFTGMLLGTALGTLAPWADHTRIASHVPVSWYLQPFFTVIVVQTFFLGSLFFAVAALSRKIFLVYLQGVALFMIYIVGITVFSATRSLERFWSTISDPIGLLAFGNVTRYWTVVEKNSLLLSWTGPYLYNRLLWIAIGLLCLAATWFFFPMSVEALTARSQGRRAARARQQDEAVARPVRSLTVARLPLIHQVFSPATTWAQFVSLTRLRISNILHEVPFWGILALDAVLSITNSYFAGHRSESGVYPVTYLILGVVEGNAQLFGYIVVALYAAELIWRERDTHFDGIHDALPVRDTPDWLSKFVALAFVALMVLATTMVCGILMQTVAGFHRYDLLQYVQELFLISFLEIMIYALLALFVQTLVSNKFIGHAIVIGAFIIQPILFNFGWENTLYLFGSTPSYTFSDMNRYGHFVQAILWSLVYWSAIAALLGILSILFTRRGAESAWGTRLRLARARLPRLIPATALCLLVAIGAGSWYFYNAHVLNEYLTAKDRRHIQADYERQFKQYENLAQPKVTAVDATINIYPERRSFDGTVTYTLQNKTSTPLTQIHLTDTKQSLSDLQFSRPTHLVSRAPRDLYSIYAFSEPLQPGETFTLISKVGHQSHGFRDGNELPEFAHNGTFFDAAYLPEIGYDRGTEISDPRRRREEKLPALEELPPRQDARGERLNLFTGPQADWITYHTTVSTSGDQIALSPGYLQRRWTENGRNYFEYSMAGTHIQDFVSWISGRYTVKSAPYKGVNVEVYYDSKHPYDVDKMIESAERGLDYDQANYSPYQFSQYRVIEYPRYRGFAQSFPNTIPYSEDIGFIGRVQNPKKDIDFAYFVTAHELGHQWWGHQLVGGSVAGSNMMSESLAEYTALRIMDHRYGDDNMRLFLKTELDGYLRGRSGEVRHENPLALVQNESYVWYQKGSVILYALSDYIGEDRLNQALGTFLRQYRYANANNQVDAADTTRGQASSDQPYPDTRQFVAALRTVTPPELQYFITDGFERIVLYDNKAVSATSQKQPDGKYKVVLTVQARKLQADGNGKESPMPINDYIDIGIFNGKKDEEKPLYLQKQHLTADQQTFTVFVDQQPTRAGIDPYNKLIDRVADDNLTDISKP